MKTPCSFTVGKAVAIAIAFLGNSAVAGVYLSIDNFGATETHQTRSDDAGVKALVSPSVNPPIAFGTKKMSDDLQTAMNAGAVFAGTTRQGRPVVYFASPISPFQATEILAKIPGTTHPTQVGEKDFDIITKLIVYGEAGKPPNSEFLKNFGVVSVYTKGGFLVIKPTAGTTATQLKALERIPGVRYLEPNYKYHLMADPPPNDPDYLNDRLWGLANIHAAGAWQTVNHSPIIVAVLDSGVDYTHPDLAANMWLNPGEIGVDSQGRNKANNGVDDDADGFVDDVYGANFLNTNGDPKPVSDHGTSCAGIIGAVGNNGIGLTGINWSVQLMAIQVMDANDELADADVIARAIDFAVQKGARILNNSWGGGQPSKAVQDAIARADQAGVLFVAAAGNEHKDNDRDLPKTYPASYTNENIIAVASIGATDVLSDFSNFGFTTVALAAPGENIWSTIPYGGYGFSSGTSMATAEVSGALALVWGSPSYQSAPALSIKQALLTHVRKLPSLAGKCSTGGTLDLAFLAHESWVPPTSTQSLLSAGGPNSVPATNSNQRTNLTLQTFKGKLRTPVFAAGGETTGVEIKTTSGDTLELDLQRNPNLMKSISEWNGKDVIVTGILRNRAGIERKNRKIIAVDKLLMTRP